MTIRQFNVSYPEFELDTIIQPDEFNVNFADIMIRFNQIIDVLNQITHGVGGNGADIIHIGDVLPFTSERLQVFLQELVDQLRANGNDSGAEFIGSARISGIEGETVHEQLVSLTTLVINVRDYVESEMEAFRTRIVTTEEAVRDFSERLAVNEADIIGKADQATTYSKTEVDLGHAQVEALIRNEFYNKVESNARYTQNTGDHKGTWGGVSLGDIGGAFGVTGAVISTSQPSGVQGRLWFNPTTQEYRIYHNGVWRVNGKPMKISKVQKRVTVGTATASIAHGIANFDPTLDAMMVFQNSTHIMEGIDYSVTRTNASNLSGTWQSGTVLDFVALIQMPV